MTWGRGGARRPLNWGRKGNHYIWALMKKQKGEPEK